MATSQATPTPTPSEPAFEQGPQVILHACSSLSIIYSNPNTPHLLMTRGRMT